MTDPIDTPDERSGSLWGLFFAGLICVAFYVAVLAACVWIGSMAGCVSTPESRVFVKDNQLCSEIVVLPEDAE